MGMGADILYHLAIEQIKNKFHAKIVFDDKTVLTIRFFGFGKILYYSDLNECKEILKIVVDPVSSLFTEDYFKRIIRFSRKSVKGFLLDQTKVSGIGNMYIHDILFNAKIHPCTKISNFDENDIINLYQSIISVLNLSKSKGGFILEKDLWGKYGGYSLSDFLIAYNVEECPKCGTAIQKIKTGSTTSYICPECQKIKR
jgi:formamidopyrimidine-DNA glycosylase